MLREKNVTSSAYLKRHILNKIIKRKGPSTNPWGTPCKTSTIDHSSEFPMNQTFRCPLEKRLKKLPSHPRTPWWYNFLNSIPQSPKLKALLRSQKILDVTKPFSWPYTITRQAHRLPQLCMSPNAKTKLVYRKHNFSF